jgi:hypothetical protein
MNYKHYVINVTLNGKPGRPCKTIKLEFIKK